MLNRIGGARSSTNKNVDDITKFVLKVMAEQKMPNHGV